jgi:HopJ type III effector protein
MKFTFSALVTALTVAPVVVAFAPFSSSPTTTTCTTTTQLQAEIRPKSEKSKELRFGWDGTTALGGAVEKAAPARMLDEIRAAGETIPEACEIFNANVEMDAADLQFQDVMTLIDTHYESQLLEFKNGAMLNKQGENEGSAKILSYAALSNMDQATTLKVRKSYIKCILTVFLGCSVVGFPRLFVAIADTLYLTCLDLPCLDLCLLFYNNTIALGPILPRGFGQPHG